MSTQVDQLMELGKSYGWAVSDYEDRRTVDTLDAMEMAEQEFRCGLAAALTEAQMPSAPQISTAGVLTSQILVMATLLERALGVVKNVEAECSDEGEQLQQLIADGEAAIAAVLQQHAMPQTAAVSADPPDHHPV